MHTGDELIQLYEACMLELYHDHCHDQTHMGWFLFEEHWVDDLLYCQNLNCHFQDLLEHFCLSLCWAVLSRLHTGRSYTYLATDCHKKGDCCKFIYSQAIELAVPLNLYTSVHEYTDIALHVLTHTSMWAQTRVLSAHRLICIFNFTTIIFLVMLASDFNGLFSSLVIYSWIPFMASE